MQAELFEINTIETLGITPRYVLQHNAISRSAHSFSSTAKKVTAMAMALLPSDLSSLSSAFTFTEFCSALGVPKGGETFLIFKDAVKECMESVIEVEGPPNKKGKKPWVMFHWFQLAEFNPDTGVCTMTFDNNLATFLKELKWLYSKINLKDIGRLRSRYALRIYELALSYSSLKGKDGNKEQTWYMERSLNELRKLFGIAGDEYKENRLFRQKVIEGPVKEINNAGIGVEIKTEGIKKGRNLVGIRFDCENTARITKKKRGGKVTALPETSPDTVNSREEKELQLLKERYPKEFEELYLKALDEQPVLEGNSLEWLMKMAAEGQALAALRERHGIVR